MGEKAPDVADTYKAGGAEAVRARADMAIEYVPPDELYSEEAQGRLIAAATGTLLGRRDPTEFLRLAGDFGSRFSRNAYEFLAAMQAVLESHWPPSEEEGRDLSGWIERHLSHPMIPLWRRYQENALPPLEAVLEEAERNRSENSETERRKRRLLALGTELQETTDPEIIKRRILEEARDLQEPPKTSLVRGSVAEDLPGLETHLEKLKSKRFIGLPTGFSQLDEKTLGLRGLMVLAAGPGVGKTTLACQWVFQAIQKDKKACAIIISLEMSRAELETRFLCCLSKQSHNDVVFLGNNIGEAKKTLMDVGQRIRIIDSENHSALSVDAILAELADLKEKTGTKRSLILLDYLNVWRPSDLERTKFWGELDEDRWRIAKMRELRDAPLRSGEEKNAVIVIAESRKPGTREKGEKGKKDEKPNWAKELADVAGTSRITYTADAVFLMLHDEMTDAELNAYGRKDLRLPSTENNDEAIQKAKTYMLSKGQDRYRLGIAKARDGMTRGEIRLWFHYRESRFEEIEG